MLYAFKPLDHRLEYMRGNYDATGIKVLGMCSILNADISFTLQIGTKKTQSG